MFFPNLVENIGSKGLYITQRPQRGWERRRFFESLEEGDAGAASLRWPLATQLSTKVGKNQNKLLADKDRIEDYEYEKAYIFADFGFYGGNLGLFQESQAGADRYCA